MRSIDKIIIHCSDSPYIKYDFEQIRRDHLGRGFRDIGYHLGIDFHGKIHVLRPIDEKGAHTRWYNKGSIGICVLGRNDFNDMQFESLGGLVSMLMRIFNLKKDDVYGHNHFSKTKTCPNFDVDNFKEKYIDGV